MLRSYIGSISKAQSRLFSSTAIKMSLDASKVKVTKVETPSEPRPNDELVFGQTFTDHMLSVEWNKENGWAIPEIKPYGNISLDPSCCVFHYGFELFEGSLRS